MENKKIVNYYKKRQAVYRRRRIAALALILFVTALAVFLVVLTAKSCASREAEPVIVDTAPATPVTQQTDPAPVMPTVSRPSFTGSTKSFDSELVTGGSAVLISLDDNTVLAQRNANSVIYPASMTKVMTLIVAVESLESEENLDDKFTMTYEIIKPLVDADATRAGFKEGEEVSVRDLLYGLILPSGGDCAVALAEYTSGSEGEFVKLMNEKCAELGQKNTHFSNTSGLHDASNYTTPIEMAMIMDYAMQNELCKEVLSAVDYTTAKTPENPDGIELFSTMFSRMYGDEVEGVKIIAGKTGYTYEAGSCLVCYAEKDAKGYIFVDCNASSGWKTVYDSFAAYENYLPASLPPLNSESAVEN